VTDEFRRSPRSVKEPATKEAPMGLSDCTVEALLAVSDLDRAKRF
jgi:hypothetical protein